MRALYLGKRRYQTRPDFEALVRLGKQRGHDLTLVDRKQLLGTSLSNVDVVFAKSHYKDQHIRAHLERIGVAVINSLTATSKTASRHQIASCLLHAKVRTPRFLTPSHPAAEFDFPCIAKPDAGGDHRLKILTSPPTEPDPNIFYQQWLPTATAWKVYSVGEQHWQVHLTYPSTTALSDPHRSPARPASQPLAQAAKKVSAALGLTVFNTDFIYDDNVLAAVDVNPFPGFSGIPGAADALWSVAEETARQ